MTPQEPIKNNAFLLNLDMKDASREQKIAWLCQIIKNEVEKPEDQRDLDLIAECSEYLEELSDEESEPSPEQIEKALQETKQKYSTPQITKPTVRKKTKPFIKLTIAATVAILVLLSSLTVAAKVTGCGNAWEMVIENIQKILNMEVGDSYNENGITLIKGDENITYDSVQTLLSSEGYNILYPDNLPNDIRITKITEQVISDTHSVLTFQFSQTNLFMSISDVRNIEDEDLLEEERYETETMIFYIKSFPNGEYQAIGHDSNYEYIVVYNDYDALISILNNMKGIQK
ncbi:MAG: hypothetical protein IJW92_03765 [Clostridia bacterium]|nr:hypothetical protein [Clostridia bacterium]